MKRSFFILCATYVFTLQSAFSYDYFELRVVWPNSYCSVSNCSSTAPPKAFKISGLWPTLANGSPAPGSNAVSQATLEAAVRNITSNLDKEWPSLLQGQTNSKLWLLEWNNHGGASKSQFDILPYFQKALELHQTRNFVNILQGKDVTATIENDYVLSQLYSILDGNIGKSNYYIECKPKKISQTLTRQLLHEVVICYNKNATAVANCNAAKITNKKKSCGACVMFPNAIVK